MIEGFCSFTTGQGYPFGKVDSTYNHSRIISQSLCRWGAGGAIAGGIESMLRKALGKLIDQITH